MNYQDAISQVFKREGGYVNNPADRGGATNYGITKKVYEAYKGREVSILEIQLMPKSDAFAIYKANYWDKIQGDKLKKYSIAAVMFDQAVNRGPATAIKQAQRILGLVQSGKMDFSTLEKLNSTDEKSFLKSYLDASADAYRSIAAKNSSQNVFLQGWLNRVEDLKKYADSVLGSVNSPASIGAFVAIGFLAYFIIQTRRA